METIAYEVLEKNEKTHWWSVGRRKILNSIIKEMDIPPNASILEVGAGTGGNIEMLKQFGCVTAMEGNLNGLNSIKKIKDINIIQGYLPDDSKHLKNKEFDLIVLLDVLEHIENDVLALKILKMHLKETGKILLSVPANPRLWSNHDIINKHFRRYTTKTLKLPIIEAGLKLKRITYFNALLFPLIALVRFKNNITKNKEFDQKRIPIKPINEMLKAIFSSECLILKKIDVPFGVSLLAIIENNNDHK